MAKFYIFLDIDGALWDVKWRLVQIFKGRIKKGGLVKSFNQESIRSLNYLIESLENKYETILVISSSWRYNMEMTKKTLFNQGLNYKKQMLKTGICTNRQKEIEEFLIENNINENFLVIDDAKLDFQQKNFIKTSIKDGCLNINKVKNWLKLNNLLNLNDIVLEN